MEVLVKDGASIVAERKAKGLDKYDEMHHGLYVVVNLPGSPHQRKVNEVQFWFRDRGVERLPGVNVGVLDNFRGPDVAAWFEGYEDATWFAHETSPDIAVEIVSPSNSPAEMLLRKNHFEEFGVKVYVEVAEDGTVTVEQFCDLPDAHQAIIDELTSAAFPE